VPTKRPAYIIIIQFVLKMHILKAYKFAQEACIKHASNERDTEIVFAKFVA